MFWPYAQISYITSQIQWFGCHKTHLRLVRDDSLFPVVSLCRRGFVIVLSTYSAILFHFSFILYHALSFLRLFSRIQYQKETPSLWDLEVLLQGAPVMSLGVAPRYQIMVCSDMWLYTWLIAWHFKVRPTAASSGDPGQGWGIESPIIFNGPGLILS